MKNAFQGFCPSDFRFPKFHLTTHYAEVIKEFGSLHTVSSAHGERTHKTEVKPAHRRTSQKKRTANSELLDVLQAKESLEQLVSAYGVQKTSGSRSRLTPSESCPSEQRNPGIATPGSTLSGYTLSDHVLQGRRYTLKSYKASDVESLFRFPLHDAAFKGYVKYS